MKPHRGMLGSFKKMWTSLLQSASLLPSPMTICLLKNCDCLKRLLQEWLLKETFCLKWFFSTATKPSLTYIWFGLSLEHSLVLRGEVKQMPKTSCSLCCNWTYKKKNPSHAGCDLKFQDRFTQSLNHPGWLALPSCLSLTFHIPPSCRVISSVGWTFKPTRLKE